MTGTNRYLKFETHRGQPHVSQVRFPETRTSFAELCVKHRFCIASVANELGVTASALREAFSSYAGISPKKWMIQYRVLLAVQALREGCEMTELIEALGYHDQPHLGKDFKSILGETPRDLRSRVQRHQDESSLSAIRHAN